MNSKKAISYQLTADEDGATKGKKGTTPMMHPEWRRRLDQWRKTMPQLFFRSLGTVELQGFCTRDQLTSAQAERGPFRPMPRATKWGAKWEYAWFRADLTLPGARPTFHRFFTARVLAGSLTLCLVLTTLPLLGDTVSLILNEPPEKQMATSAFVPHRNDTLLIDAKHLKGDLKSIEINGIDCSDTTPMTNGMALCQPKRGWQEGVNHVRTIVQVGTSKLEYTLYVMHQTKQISTVAWSNDTVSLDGVPFFPMGIYAVNEPSIPAVAEYGFNIIQSYQRTSDLPLATNVAWFDAAARHKLKVMWGIGNADVKKQDFEKLARYIATLMLHPSLFCYYTADEPDGAGIPPDALEKVNTFIHGLDPFHPIIISTWEIEKYYRGATIDFRQCYHGYPAGVAKELGLYSKRTRSLGVGTMAILNTHDLPFARGSDVPDAGNSPEYMYCKLTEGTPEWKKAEARAALVGSNLSNPPFPFWPAFPKDDRFRACAYTAIAKGSPGLFWWLWQDPASWSIRWSWYTVFHNAKTAPCAKRTISELKQLTPLISNPAKDSTSWEDNGLLFWVRSGPVTNIVISINLAAEPRSARVALQGWKGDDAAAAQVLGENREIQITDSTLQDSWGPEEAHVYISIHK